MKNLLLFLLITASMGLAAKQGQKPSSAKELVFNKYIIYGTWTKNPCTKGGDPVCDNKNQLYTADQTAEANAAFKDYCTNKRYIQQQTCPCVITDPQTSATTSTGQTVTVIYDSVELIASYFLDYGFTKEVIINASCSK
jgi:hypothetical protein